MLSLAHGGGDVVAARRTLQELEGTIPAEKVALCPKVQYTPRTLLTPDVPKDAAFWDSIVNPDTLVLQAPVTPAPIVTSNPVLAATAAAKAVANATARKLVREAAEAAAAKALEQAQARVARAAAVQSLQRAAEVVAALEVAAAEPEVAAHPEVAAAQPEVAAHPEVAAQPEVAAAEPEVVAALEVAAAEPEVVAKLEVSAQPEVAPSPAPPVIIAQSAASAYGWYNPLYWMGY
jgi:hypothetical protein